MPAPIVSNGRVRQTSYRIWRPTRWSHDPSNSPSLFAVVVFVPGTRALVIGAAAPVLNLAIVPATLALSVAAFAPVLNLRLSPAVATLALTTFAPTIGVSVSLNEPIEFFAEHDVGAAGLIGHAAAASFVVTHACGVAAVVHAVGAIAFVSHAVEAT